MRLSFFASLTMSFPNADIRFTHLGAEVYDLSGEMIGYVPNREVFVLRAEYTHYDKAKDALQVKFEVQSDMQALYK